MHEAQMHDESAFVTLTYDPEKLPTVSGLPTLDKSHFPLFMRALRKRVRKTWKGTEGEVFVGPRFLQAGEYGSLGRPHHHALIFGWFPREVTRWKTTKAGHHLYRSPELEELWPHGFSSVGHVSFESAAYVARYTLKKLTGEALQNFGPRVAEYATMSLKPGIGHAWAMRYGAEVFADDEVALRGGSLQKPPRFYLDLFKKHNPEGYARLKAIRKAMEEDRPERMLYARETIAKSKAALYGRRKGPS